MGNSKIWAKIAISTVCQGAILVYSRIAGPVHPFSHFFIEYPYNNERKSELDKSIKLQDYEKSPVNSLSNNVIPCYQRLQEKHVNYKCQNGSEFFRFLYDNRFNGESFGPGPQFV
jgi:hypothetical protein